MRAYYIAIFLLTFLSAGAQEIELNLTMGVGTYAMHDLKNFQSDMRSRFPFKPAITDDFPPYLFYEFSGHWKSDGIFFSGFAIAYGSTGGRVQYRDYSGYLRADQLLQYVNLAVPMGLSFGAGKNMQIRLDLKPTYTRTFANLKFEQDVAGEYAAQDNHFTSYSVAAQPGIWLMRRINRFGIHAQASYYVTIVNGKMYSKENDSAYLVDSNNSKPIYAGWDGIRLSLGASFVLSD
jgi:hypothetical protein